MKEHFASESKVLIIFLVFIPVNGMTKCDFTK